MIITIWSVNKALTEVKGKVVVAPRGENHAKSVCGDIELGRGGGIPINMVLNDEAALVEGGGQINCGHRGSGRVIGV